MTDKVKLRPISENQRGHGIKYRFLFDEVEENA